MLAESCVFSGQGCVCSSFCTCICQVSLYFTHFPIRGWTAKQSSRLALSNKCLQTLLRFRLGCHNLPWDVGSRTAVPRSQRLCPVAMLGQPGDEFHLVIEGQFLQQLYQKYPGLFGQHAGTMIQIMWQAMEYPNLSQSVWAYIIALTLEGSRHLISPRWLEEI